MSHELASAIFRPLFAIVLFWFVLLPIARLCRYACRRGWHAAQVAIRAHLTRRRRRQAPKLLR